MTHKTPRPKEELGLAFHKCLTFSFSFERQNLSLEHCSLLLSLDLRVHETTATNNLTWDTIHALEVQKAIFFPSEIKEE